MSRIRGSDTSPELELRRALDELGVAYGTHGRTPFGRPDLVFPDAQVAVFIDGCFWHGCPFHYVRPKSRSDFWSEKLTRNLARDAGQSDALDRGGWKPVRVWEHDIVQDTNAVAEFVDSVVRGDTASSWRTERRVRRVVELADGNERREIVLLGAPDAVVEAVIGPRVTAKARRGSR